MANKKQGNLTPSPQWWKHLRDWKRIFWKSERNAQKKDIKDRIKEWASRIKELALVAKDYSMAEWQKVNELGGTLATTTSLMDSFARSAMTW